MAVVIANFCAEGEVERGGGDAVVVMAEDIAFVDKIASDWLHTESADAV